jgi:hypothetical protein
MNGSVPRQLSLIEDFFAIADDAGIECWLRGGWAVDFFLGEVTRTHGDIDLFVWASDGAKIISLLQRAGYRKVEGPPSDEQFNFVKEGEELHVALLARTPTGDIASAGKRWSDTPWPAGMLNAPLGRIGNIQARVINPEVQLWMKEMLPTWLPDRPLREHDRGDIERLRAALRR